VDSKLFVGDFEPTMKFAGLSGAMAKKSGQVSEGCAIFWRDVKFELVASHRFVLAERLLDGCPHLGSILTAVKANGELFKEMIERTTVLQAVVLKSKIVPQTYFVVGNTHLYFRPDADHIRLLHTAMAMVELEKLVEETKSLESEASVHLMLCGDFNSTPPFAVVELMTKGHIGEDHADWSSCPGQEVSGLSVKHPFSMASACGTPKYTNFTQGFKDCLDYIFYQTDGLRVAQVVPFPSEEELSTHVAIPSVVFPSDHIACVADLELMNQGK
jgi:2',5'-phosphodiesterase